MTILARLLIAGLLAAAAFGAAPLRAQDPAGDVRRLVEAARALDTAWPWQPAIPEVAQVAGHGAAAGPLLLRELRYGPSTEPGDWDLHVEQQVALALCLIYGETPVSGETVWGVRSPDEKNRKVRAFWRDRVARGAPAAQ